jgi:hypothetical protein
MRRLGWLVFVVCARPITAQPAASRSQAADPTRQIAILLLPLPDSLRAGAGAAHRDAGGRIVTLKPSRNHLVCRRIVPGEEPFDVRCYHEAFWPVVDRMLALKAEHVQWDDLVGRIHAELAAKTLPLPAAPTAGYRMLGPLRAIDTVAGRWTREMERWQSLHVPFQTAGAMGLPIDEQRDMPYVMASGTFWAHLMFEHSR